MKKRQAKKIFKASFTYWRYLFAENRMNEFRPLPYWSHGFTNVSYWDAKAYKERANPRFREALRGTREFGKMIYKVAWGSTICH